MNSTNFIIHTNNVKEDLFYMDKNKIRNYQVFSNIFVCILGTLLHFTYELSGENSIIASFSAVNESVWEHLKLLFFPMLLTTIIGYFYCANNKVLGTSPTGFACEGGSGSYIGKNVPNFLCSKMIGIITAMLFTVIFFYTYSGILGNNIAIIDISLFFVATILGEYVAYKLMNSTFKCNTKIAIFALILIGICFLTFTYSAPKIGIFKDPITKTYGIVKNEN